MADAPPMEVMVRTYAGQNQPDAASLFAQDAPRLADDGWVPVPVRTLLVTYQRPAAGSSQ